MAEANDIRSIILQNLIDAGCNKEMTDKCISLIDNGKISEFIAILLKHRSNLLKAVHPSHKKIDCLDYLIYKIKKINLEE